jgi:hypothetical protein
MHEGKGKRELEKEGKGKREREREREREEGNLHSGVYFVHGGPDLQDLLDIALRVRARGLPSST